MPAFDASSYTLSQPKPLPVIFLLDCSGSMYGPKMATLNQAFQKMLREFGSPQQEKDIYVAAITFSNEAKVAIPLQQPQSILDSWHDFEAQGQTAMAAAIRLATDIIESDDKEVRKLLLPTTKSYRPVVILISDGEASEGKEEVVDVIEKFAFEGKRTQKCDRWALAIGKDFNFEPLNSFLSRTDNEVICIDGIDLSGISSFFETLTLTVTQTVANSAPAQKPTQTGLGY